MLMCSNPALPVPAQRTQKRFAASQGQHVRVWGSRHALWPETSTQGHHTNTNTAQQCEPLTIAIMSIQGGQDPGSGPPVCCQRWLQHNITKLTLITLRINQQVCNQNTCTGVHRVAAVQWYMPHRQKRLLRTTP